MLQSHSIGVVGPVFQRRCLFQKYVESLLETMEANHPQTPLHYAIVRLHGNFNPKILDKVMAIPVFVLGLTCGLVISRLMRSH